MEEIMQKEYYIVDCWDFVYFARPVHIIGMSDSSYECEIEYIIDVIDTYNGDYRTMYMEQLDRFKTLSEAEKEAKRLNNIPKNKERAKEWNNKGKFICKILNDLNRKEDI